MRSALAWLSREAGLRFLARRKAACAVAVLTMALALGANTAVFSVVKTFLLASIGVPDAQRLFLIAPVRNLPGRGSVVFNEAYPNYQLIRSTQRAFADWGAHAHRVRSPGGGRSASASRRRGEGPDEAGTRGDARESRFLVRGPTAARCSARRRGLDGAARPGRRGRSPAARVLNLASLLLAWGFERRQELAVRQALGAGHGRVVRMLFLQSVVVVGLGAVLGVASTRLIVPWLRHLDLNQTLTFFTSQIRLDPSVLFASAVVAVLSGLAAGILPAFFSRNADVATELRAGARSATLSPAALRWQQTMVVLQAALSVVILAAAALIGVSFVKLVRVPIGFAPRDLLVARINLQSPVYQQSAARTRFGRDLLDNLAREPEIAFAAFTSTLPVGDGLWGGRFFIELPDGSMSTEAMLLHIRRASTNYLPTIGIPLLTGRQFATSDDSVSPRVAIVSRSLAARLWPNESAIGKRIYRLVVGFPQPVAHEVIGIAGDVMDAGNSVPPGETVYLPWDQVSTTQMSIRRWAKSGNCWRVCGAATRPAAHRSCRCRARRSESRRTGCAGQRPATLAEPVAPHVRDRRGGNRDAGQLWRDEPARLDAGA